MKNLINYLSKKSLSLDNGSGMTRKWFGNDSGMIRFSLTSLICLCMLTIGVGNAWGDNTVVYYESFGSTTSNTGFSSYSGYSATTSMFSTSGTVKSHYSGSGSVGKNNLAAANLSNGYTGASGLSGCYHTGTANTQATIIQISDINISGYSNLHLSFGALGGASTHKVIVTYKIDNGSETTLISSGSITNASWTLIGEDIASTGSSLTIYIKHKPTRAWTIRLDDIKVTGCPAPKTLTNGTITATTARLSWADSDDTGSYEVYCSTSSSTPAANATPTTTVSNKYVDLTSLLDGTPYYWWVRSKCSNTSKSAWVAGTSFSTPSACTLLASINGSINWTNGTQANLTWDNLDHVTSYTVTYKTGAGDYVSTNVGSITTNGAGKKTCSITGLTPGTTYTFKIAATAADGYCDKSQEITATAPLITATGTITGLNYAEGNGSSAAQTFTVSGVGLTGDITVTAPTNFEVCKNESGTYSSSVSFSPTSGILASSTVYVRLAANKSVGTYGPSAITISGGGAADNTSVTVQGIVSPACHDPNITGQPASSTTYNMNATATALSVTAAKGDAGDPDLTYQWYSNTANSTTTPEPTAILNATGSTYTPPTTSTGTVYYFCEVSSGICSTTSNIAAVTVNTPTITVSETARAFGDRKKDGSYTMTFTVSGSNLAKDAGISLAISGTNAGMFSIDKTSLSATSNAVATTTITVTYNPTATGAHSAQIDITSTGATTKTVALSGTGRNEYTVTFNDNGSITAEKWLDQSVHATPDISACKAKYSVLGWTTTAPTSNAWASAPSVTAAGNNITVTGNATYYAVYTEEGATPTNNYRKITSQSELISGREYVITNTGDSYALNCTSFYDDYSFGKTSVSPSAGVLTTTTAAMIFTITGNTSEGYSIYSAYDGGYGIGYGYVEDVGKDTLAAYNYPYQDWKITVNDGGNTYIQPKEALYDYFYFDSWWWLKKTATANHLYRRVFNTTYIANPDCRTLESIAVKTEPETNYCEEDWLDMSDLVITATYTDASTEDIDYASNVGDFTFSPSTSTDLTSSNTSVTITYGGKSTSQTISVGTLRSITLTGSGTVANGTISADMSMACAGETVTLTATPNTHYSLGSWTVTGATSGDNITVTNNQFTMPDENVTINATMSEDPYRMVVFQNDGVATFDDGGDASAVDATNKWKQKVYVGEAPVWPTKLTDVTDACDATSNKFYGWATNTWSDVLADADALAAWDGGSVYTAGPLATVAAGTGDVVYHAVWAKTQEGSDWELITTLAGIKEGDAYMGSYHSYSGSRYYAGTSISTTQNVSVSGTPLKLSSTTGLQKVSIVATATANQYQIKNGTKYLYANYTGSAPSWSDTECAWLFSDINANYLFKVKSSLGTYYLRAYATSTTAGAFKMYGDQTNSGICLFQKGVTYANFLTSCCDKKVTLSEPVITDAASSGSTVTYTESSAVATCDGAKEVHVTITPAAGYQATSISFGGTATQTGVSPAISTPLTTAQTYTISYAKEINGTLVPTVTFEKKTATAWTWTYNSGAIPDPLVLYVGINKQLDVTYEPVDLLNDQKNYSVTKESSVAEGGKGYAYYKMRGAAGVSAETNSTVTFTLNGLSQTVNVTVKPQPKVYFVDIVHNETFDPVMPAVASFVANFVRQTPTHADVAEPGTGNSCEKQHLHLIGWIRSDYSKVEDYLNGTGAKPSITELTDAGTDGEGLNYYFEPNADINVEDYNGLTFYAVWAKK